MCAHQAHIVLLNFLDFRFYTVLYFYLHLVLYLYLFVIISISPLKAGMTTLQQAVNIILWLCQTMYGFIPGLLRQRLLGQHNLYLCSYLFCNTLAWWIFIQKFEFFLSFQSTELKLGDPRVNVTYE